MITQKPGSGPPQTSVEDLLFCFYQCWGAIDLLSAARERCDTQQDSFGGPSKAGGDGAAEDCKELKRNRGPEERDDIKRNPSKIRITENNNQIGQNKIPETKM